MRKLEAGFAVLIATMALAFAWMFGDTKPSGKELLMGKILSNDVVVKTDMGLLFNRSSLSPGFFTKEDFTVPDLFTKYERF